ncbi:MAG: hypothetical protein OEL88_04870 [Sterolibacteriaceae bacterium MAG5]|nr:hypothetical protein [Candidatus Nitricoxidireducens bremensis]
MSDPRIDEAVRRTVGIAALRRLRRMVDAEAAADAASARWARRLSWILAVAAVLAVAWIGFR